MECSQITAKVNNKNGEMKKECESVCGVFWMPERSVSHQQDKLLQYVPLPGSWPSKYHVECWWACCHDDRAATEATRLLAAWGDVAG